VRSEDLCASAVLGLGRRGAVDEGTLTGPALGSGCVALSDDDNKFFWKEWGFAQRWPDLLALRRSVRSQERVADGHLVRRARCGSAAALGCYAAGGPVVRRSPGYSCAPHAEQRAGAACLMMSARSRTCGLDRSTGCILSNERARANPRFVAARI
jgi:hypothetical protein